MEYKNPTPVVVGLVMIEPHKLLFVRRAIPPIGGIALPGGYVNLGENWREALSREIEEETNVIVSSDRKHMRSYDTESTPNGGIMLTFAIIEPKGVLEVRPFVKNAEVSERIILPYHKNTPQLCFSLHADVLERFKLRDHAQR